MHRGKLIVVVGPTGSGKGTLIAHAMQKLQNLEPSISCTTRAPRPGEENGVHYYFITREEFEERIEQGKFLEWAEYGGNYYGTPLEGVESRLASGVSVILEIEVQGARIVKAHTTPDDLCVVYIDAGSWESLEKRIRARAPIDDAEVVKRRERYEDERSFMNEADVIISNNDGEVEKAKEDFIKALASVVS